MRKISRIGLLGLSIMAFLVSCESSSFSTSTIRTAETKDVFVSVPLVVEYDTIYSQRVTDTSQFNMINEESIASLKKRAIVNCSNKYKCDIILNPTYDISFKSGMATIIVSGLPAKYKSIRQATVDDLWILKFYE